MKTSKLAARARLLWGLMRAALLLPLYIASLAVPRRRDLWIFGCWEGRRFCDNAKYLFLHVRARRPDIEAVWLTKEPRVLAELRSERLPAELIGTWRAVRVALRAGFAFITHSVQADLDPPTVGGATLVHLFHATLPIKMMGLDHSRRQPAAKRLAEVLEAPWNLRRGDLAVASSEETAAIVSGALGIPRPRVMLTGFPRTDLLLGEVPPYGPDGAAVARVRGGGRLIHFVPTFRVDPAFHLFRFGFDRGRLEALLERTDSRMAFRFHPFEAQRYRADLRPGGRIVLDDTEDVYPLLREAAVLVTDYSSIPYDFVLLDRPIVFANFDHEGYLKERALYHDYAETPGPKAPDWPALERELERSLTGTDAFREARERWRRRLYPAQAGGACARIAGGVGRGPRDGRGRETPA